ncbi:MAG: hypothetical protein VYE77_07350 [Planctomycetota bacterium]|nr:hypothetical protein [Planctomycetota bacterium]
MMLQNLSILPFVLGLAGLAAALFALQRLRVRHRDLVVPTTLFWKEAVEEARARTLVERFRHLLPFLLVLCIGALLWTAIASPRSGGAEDVEHLVLVDASADMAVDGRFEQAKEHAARAAASLPRESTTIRLCAAIPESLLLPGENPHLLEHRLAGVAAAACPSSIGRELRKLPAGEERQVRVWVIGGRALPEALLELLPDRVDVQRIPCEAQDAGPSGRITVLAVTEAASGRYDRCDLLVQAEGSVALPLLVRLGDDEPLRIEPEPVDDATSQYRLTDLATTGSLLVAELSSEQALGPGGRAELRLPRRRILRVGMAADGYPALRDVLAADPAVELVEDGAELLVRPSGGPPAGVPVFEYAPASVAQHAFVVRGPAIAESPEELAAWLPRIGLDSIDAMELAQSASRPISIGAEAAPARSVQVWSELLTERFDFTRTRAFPVFVGRAVRWLAGEPQWRSWLAAGEVSDITAAVIDAQGRTQDPCGAPLTPLEAGPVQFEDGESVSFALLDPAPATPAVEGADGVAMDLPGVRPDWWSLLALAALLLLGVEWFLYRTGRMP